MDVEQSFKWGCLPFFPPVQQNHSVLSQQVSSLWCSEINKNVLNISYKTDKTTQSIIEVKSFILL